MTSSWVILRTLNQSTVNADNWKYDMISCDQAELSLKYPNKYPIAHPWMPGMGCFYEQQMKYIYIILYIITLPLLCRLQYLL